jgi:predicted HicB family RNase H-like nuclease
MELIVKRIIDGMTYNTQTATEVFCSGPVQSDAWHGVYQTRHGAFFKVVVDHDGETVLEFGPLTDNEAQAEVQKHAPHLVDDYFGPFPEAGAAERRLTIRVPANLATRIETAAQAKSLSVNSYAMRCFEQCVTADGHPPVQT